MSIVTDEEAKEVGVKKEVYQNWVDIMQALWTASIAFYRGMGSREMFFPKNGENEILIGNVFKISASMVNNSYVSVSLFERDKELVEIRYDGNVNPICQCLFLILKYKNHSHT
jgi:hypothetical protein